MPSLVSRDDRCLLLKFDSAEGRLSSGKKCEGLGGSIRAAISVSSTDHESSEVSRVGWFSNMPGARSVVSS